MVKYMLKYLQPDMNPWQFELDGSEKAKNDGYRILGTKYPNKDNQIKAASMDHVGVLKSV